MYGININNNEQLVLGYNLIKKLNIVSNDGNKFSSLLNILNNSNTNIGKRYFEKCLLNPLTNVEDINDKYENIELMMLKNNSDNNDNFIFETLRKKLKDFCDLERFFRKIFLLKLQPQEFINIYNSKILVNL